jgi:tetratricopeptide (TPR) repeat protein
MSDKKQREPIPQEIAARVLYLADRTCCVCRGRGKPVQIHHIDDDPSNNKLENLAVVCFDCHRETQIKGGFDRKLDADQVILYRDNWNEIVATKRAAYEVAKDLTFLKEGQKLEEITSIVEIFRENEEFGFLANLYHSIGNYELRDKYIELALAKNPSDFDIVNLRCLQGKPELIPEEVIKREEIRYASNEDWSQKARFSRRLGKPRDAVEDYVRGILRSLEKGSTFSAAYYLKELIKSNLGQELFIIAFKEAIDRGDLWWQVRALDELGWQKELDEHLLKNAKEIEDSGDLNLNILLAKARGNTEQYLELRKEMMRSIRSLGSGVARVKRKINDPTDV